MKVEHKMAAKSISSVEVSKLHGAFNLRHTFTPGINVIYGQNGAGKTTLLHILANALAGDYDRFVFLQFETIAVTIGVLNDTLLSLHRSVPKYGTVVVDVRVNNSKLTRIRATFSKAEGHRARTRYVPPRTTKQPDPQPAKPVCNASYFPAFRSMLDAWVSASREGLLRPILAAHTPTDFARRLFGQFIPQLTYPSLIDIEEKLRDEVRHAFRLVSEAETTQMGQAAEAVFRAILSEPQQGQPANMELPKAIISACNRIKQVSELLGRKPGTDLSRLAELVGTPLSPHARSILEVYERTLQRVAAMQEEAIYSLDAYLKSINSFFTSGEKRLKIAEDGEVRVGQEKGGRELSLRTLSSGERQIVAMLYEATHMSDKEVVLIDEPELSLHIDWQRPLINQMAKQMGEKQIIVATHSPVIGSDIDVLQELALTDTDAPLATRTTSSRRLGCADLYRCGGRVMTQTAVRFGPGVLYTPNDYIREVKISKQRRLLVEGSDDKELFHRLFQQFFPQRSTRGSYRHRRAAAGILHPPGR